MLQVLDWELQRQLVPYMKEHVPLPGIYDADFIAANQDTRADNIIKSTRSEQVEQVRQQIRTFKEEQKLDKVHAILLNILLTAFGLCNGILLCVRSQAFGHTIATETAQCAAVHCLQSMGARKGTSSLL